MMITEKMIEAAARLKRNIADVEDQMAQDIIEAHTTGERPDLHDYEVSLTLVDAKEINAALSTDAETVEGKVDVHYAYCCPGSTKYCDCVNKNHGTAWIDENEIGDDYVRVSPHASSIFAYIEKLEAALSEQRQDVAGPSTGMRTLQSWVYQQRVSLQTNDPEYFAKYGVWKAVGAQIRVMLPAAPAAKLGDVK